jgi:hypothetical protein
MKKILIIIALMFCSYNVFSQEDTYSIEYETHKVGVFNPQWEVDHSLNANKYEHITGFFREELAKTIINAIKTKQVKIYDIRKREITLDTVIKQVINFEKINFNKVIGKDSALNYIIPFISAYDFEEAVTYNYKNLSIDKKVTAYCPYLVRYKKFNGEKNDSIQMPLFWIFPKDTMKFNPNSKPEDNIISIPDTVLSVLQLKYPVQMPMSTSIFDNVQGKKIKVYHSDGSEFKVPKEIDDLFVISHIITIYNDTTGKDTTQKVFSDIVPEDIIGLRIGENWAINKKTLEIMKKVDYFLPLYKYDEDSYTQLGVRIYNNPKKN